MERSWWALNASSEKAFTPLLAAGRQCSEEINGLSGHRDPTLDEIVLAGKSHHWGILPINGNCSIVAFLQISRVRANASAYLSSSNECSSRRVFLVSDDGSDLQHWLLTKVA